MSGLSGGMGGGGYSASASSSASTGPASSGFGGGGLFIQGITTGGYAGQAGAPVGSSGVPEWVYMAAVALLAVMLLKRR